MPGSARRRPAWYRSVSSQTPIAMSRLCASLYRIVVTALGHPPPLITFWKFEIAEDNIIDHEARQHLLTLIGKFISPYIATRSRQPHRGGL